MILHTSVDFHTHILPGVDDGSRSVEESLEMLRHEAQSGVGHVVATPHFYANHESPERFLEKRGKAEEKLRAAMQDVEGLPSLSMGAEVHFFEGMSDADRLPDMAIAGTGCVLVEMPMKHWSDRNLQELVGIYQKRRLIPIVAHMDRYVTPFRANQIPNRLSQLPIPLLIQVNADFFTNRWSQRLALKLLQQGRIHLLGSDCHHMKHRPPNLDGALKVIERSLGVAQLEKMRTLEQKVLAGAGAECLHIL